jgi:dihydroorotate dehydrogenase (NAD+) catalytic subunit
MYDANSSYEENYAKGPSRLHVDGKKFPLLHYLDSPTFKFLGTDLQIPFGIPAGPLLNAEYVNAALRAGFCLPVYKTVRSCAQASHPFPNVLVVNAKGSLRADEKVHVTAQAFTEANYKLAIEAQPVSITNSFGVPSREPKEWQRDLLKVNPQPGQTYVLSFQATRKGQDFEDLVADAGETTELAAGALVATGGSLLEINLSCPNEGGEPLFQDLDATMAILKTVKSTLRNFPKVKLIAKIGMLTEKQTDDLVMSSRGIVDAFSAINTISCRITDSNHQIVLGSQHTTGGVCGSAIFDAGVTMVSRLARARKRARLDAESLPLIGVGGVRSVREFQAYREAGAQVVQAATGAMWNLDLASDIAKFCNVPFEKGYEK